MKKEIFEHLYKTEKYYWWFVGQRYLLRQSIKGHHLKILDVGCGTGINMELLEEYGSVTGIDISDDALSFCRKRWNLDVHESDVMNIKFKDSSFDMVTSMGVFYHKGVTDDLQAFREIHRVLKDNGRLVFLDSGMKCLYGKHDLAFDGTRRYSKKELKGKLEQAGFEIEKISYVNFVIFPLVYLIRKFKKSVKSDVNPEINPFLNRLMRVLFIAEINLLKCIDYPFGVNIFVIAKKK